MPEKEKSPWQTGAAEMLDHNDPPHLRVSATSKCIRALHYSANGMKETDPPDEEAQNRMALGHMAEVLIIRAMERRGWETDNTVLSPDGQMDLEIEITTANGETKKLPGHPDGRCRHEYYTNGKWVPLECKQMNDDLAVMTRATGIASVYPGYILQIGIYGREMKRRDLVQSGEAGVFGMMDRGGRMLPPERVRWSSKTIDDALAKMAAVADGKEGPEPVRPHQKGSDECAICPYHTLCWGIPPDRPLHPAKKPMDLNDNRAACAAAEIWLETKPQNDIAKTTLQDLVEEMDGRDITMAGVTAGYFAPKDPPRYDASKLEEMIPSDILRQCQTEPGKSKAFWVRKSRKY